MPRAIYADFNGTTPPGSGAKAWMSKALETWGNPSSVHALGQQARGLLDEARASVAKACGRKPSEVVFTSGGSEANTMALWGSAMGKKDYRILTSTVEHSSVRDTCTMLARLGAKVEYVKIKASGELDWDDFVAKLDRFNPNLISLMTANNETGVLFPVPEIVREARARKILVHTDAVQALGKLSATYWEGADLISLSAHKIRGPKGVGALLLRDGLQLESTHFGGGQETKRRGGTENLMGICGFAGACSELSQDPHDDASSSLATLRNRFEAEIKEFLTGTTIVGETARRLSNTSNIRFRGISSEVLLSALDLDGLYISAGSACSSGSLKPSPVLLAMGFSENEARECVRFSWGVITTESEILEAAKLVASHVTRIRERKGR